MPGSCVTVTLEGSRPLLAEVQALVASAGGGGSPRRAVSGLDSQRVAMVNAVVERRGRVRLADADVFAASVGGVRIVEPAADLALALAIASAAKDHPLPPGVVAVGEVGLSGEIRRVGGTELVNVNTRVVSATNRDIREAIVKGQFREELYYRINVIEIRLPPLRERAGDIPLLIHHFVQEFCRENDREFVGITDEAMTILQNYDWPGNVRELRNMVERLVIMTPRETIGPEDLPSPLRPADLAMVGDGAHQNLREARESFERAYILGELRANGWNITKTSKQLGIGRVNLWRKLKSYGISG